MLRENREELYVTVPSFFRCPISMDVMKSPVSLCTGVTYDRSSIQTWLSQGHNTCPATMQVLHSTDIIPNLTLRRLIHLWSEVGASTSSPSLPSLSRKEVVDSLRIVAESDSKKDRVSSLLKIAGFTKLSEENRKFLANLKDFVSIIVDAMSNVDEIEVCESAIAVLDLIASEEKVKEQLQRLMFKSNRDCLSPIVSILRKGNLISKIQSARFLESIASNTEFQRAISEKQGLLFELYRLITTENDCSAKEAGFSALISVSTTRSVNKELIGLGIVRSAGKILSDPDTVVPPFIEKVLKLLEIISTCTEGRMAISEDENCVPAIVQRLMKVSSAATEHGLTVLWSVCYLARHRTAQEAVAKSNGVTKVLVVMQSDCSAMVRQMCGDLVKVLRVNTKSCLASYETRTTHIMPY